MNGMKDDSHLVAALIDVMNAALAQNFTRTNSQCSDLEVVLAALRTLRPAQANLDLLEAMIRIRSGDWDEAIRILLAAEAVVSQGADCKALLAFALYRNGDSGWRLKAQEAMREQCTPAAQRLVTAIEEISGSGSSTVP